MTMISHQKLIEVERKLSHRPRNKAVFLENKMKVSDTVKKIVRVGGRSHFTDKT